MPIINKLELDGKFIILSGPLSFHSSAIESVYIKSNKANLCRQKEFVYNLKLLLGSPVVTSNGLTKRGFRCKKSKGETI